MPEFAGFPQDASNVKKWYPRLDQGGGVAVTKDTIGLYRTDGLWVQAFAVIFPAATGTGANGIAVLGLPFPTNFRRIASSPAYLHALGNFIYADSGTGNYAGTVGGPPDGSGFPAERTGPLFLYTHGNTSVVGSTPNIAIATADTLTINLSFPMLYTDYAALKNP